MTRPALDTSGRAASRRARLVPRALAAVIAFLALGGPSPGHVGSCDGSGELADQASFCEAYQTWYCAREVGGLRLNGTMYNECIRRTGPSGPYAECTGFNFMPGCEPSQRSADACIRALEAATDLSIPTTNIIQCDFCGGV